MQAEPLTLVARRDSGIRALDDLAGGRINIGDVGSRERALMDMVMEAKGWTAADFALANELPATQQSLALCHAQVEAVVYAVAHPDPAVAQVIELCDARIVTVAGPEIDALVDESPFLAFAVIPGGLYGAGQDAVKTFGMRTSLVSSTNVDADTAYLLVKTVFDNIRALAPDASDTR
jgi:TRAP transporter TAXI family solute receptor